MKNKGDFYQNVNYSYNRLLFLDKNRGKFFQVYDLLSEKK